ncbi:hypothetical protein Scep_019068 [Stephania cephalantha]|uniref:Gag-pol polyprotein n=1 Tax=Stephania cephalantha TaxID=152367 RepID=A0AAP0NMH8_9MAGN
MVPDCGSARLFIRRLTGSLRDLFKFLRTCSEPGVQQFGGSWEEFLPLCEFAYNNSYQASIGMPPFEALYGRPCRSPACWAEPDDVAAVGPEIVVDHTEKIRLIRQRLQAAQIDKRSTRTSTAMGLSYEVDDWVYLKVSPLKGLTWERESTVRERYLHLFQGKDLIKFKFQDEIPFSLEDCNGPL